MVKHFETATRKQTVIKIGCYRLKFNILAVGFDVIRSKISGKLTQESIDCNPFIAKQQWIRFYVGIMFIITSIICLKNDCQSFFVVFFTFNFAVFLVLFVYSREECQPVHV